MSRRCRAVSMYEEIVFFDTKPSAAFSASVKPFVGLQGSDEEGGRGGHRRCGQSLAFASGTHSSCLVSNCDLPGVNPTRSKLRGCRDRCPPLQQRCRNLGKIPGGGRIPGCIYKALPGIVVLLLSPWLVRDVLLLGGDGLWACRSRLVTVIQQWSDLGVGPAGAIVIFRRTRRNPPLCKESTMSLPHRRRRSTTSTQSCSYVKYISGDFTAGSLIGNN